MGAGVPGRAAPCPIEIGSVDIPPPKVLSLATIGLTSIKFNFKFFP